MHEKFFAKMFTKHIYLLLFFFLLWVTAETFARKSHVSNNSNGRRSLVKSQAFEISSNSTSVNKSNNATSKMRRKFDQGEKDVFLRIKSHMKDINATSGEDAHFKCKVDGRPKKNIRYIWFRNNFKISNRDRFVISQRSWGSRLLIKNLYTFDSGVYRCEASNGLRRVHSSAKLKVFFERPPAPSPEEKVKINLPQGKCESYRGSVCNDYFGKYGVYLEEFEDQTKMEDALVSVVDSLKGDSQGSATECQIRAVPAFCYYIFRPCVIRENNVIRRSERLCREDCELLKRDVCREEYLTKGNIFSANQSDSAECLFLPSMSSSNCTKLLLSSNKPNHNPNIDTQDCYDGNGENYRGTANTAETGNLCARWPSHMIENYPRLLGDHSYCRNPDAFIEKPWCYVDTAKLQKMPCKIEKCKNKQERAINHLIIIASCAGALFCFIVVFVAICCIRRRRYSKSSTSPSEISSYVQHLKPPLYAAESKLPHLNASSVRMLAEIGRGNFGNVYKGAIVNDHRFTCNDSYAIISMKDTCLRSRLEEFRHEMEVMTELQHPNVASLKAVVDQSNIHCMIFEYTEQVDLHEHLALNSPSRNSTKRSKVDSASNHAFSTIDNVDFVEMAIQIAAGMEYLTSRNYIHQDLAARNVLICGNMEMKISNLSAIRDSYMSSYYTTPQNKLMPIRWMAPESLHSWKFSDKSTIWSFGVLLWEMFSYGLQPYCGYSNHEVLDMISRRQLLACPDQCPAKIYSLMRECWSNNTKRRPSFQELHNRLRSWMETGEVMIVQSSYLNRNQFELSPSPPPEYQSHCSSQNQSQNSNQEVTWNGNSTPSERSFTSTATARRPFGTLSRAYQHHHQAESFMITETNSLNSHSGSLMASV